MTAKSALDDVFRRLQKDRSLVLNLIADEAYSFECRGCFGSTLTVRISRRGTRITLAATFREHYRPGHSVCKSLGAPDWERLLAALRQADFWALPERHERIGLDGSTWTIKGRRGETRHRSEQWSPPSDAYHDLGLRFTELSGLELPHDAP